jgi:hypothetical protein
MPALAAFLRLFLAGASEGPILRGGRELDSPKTSGAWNPARRPAAQARTHARAQNLRNRYVYGDAQNCHSRVPSDSHWLA